ncbi:hypothetical protein [Nocardia pseudovaccinii]|uniref:hypothetical protein n=1 Tax=Nocardia pseudovaccinii TaxID=189540 RepID=UPI0007A40334|nr:hypothetical protein [Nocardia pseudovaccinii]
MPGSLVVVSVDWPVVVSVAASASLPDVAVSSGTGTSFGASELLATSLIAPISVVVSAVLDVSETSDDAKTLPAFSFRLESAAATAPITSAISTAAAAA